MDYAQLNGIRLTDVHMDKQTFDVTGEAASAYVPSLGLKSFTRRLQLQGAGQLKVSDVIVQTKPQPLSEVLHTDTSFTPGAGSTYTTTIGRATLHVAHESSQPVEATVQPNIVMGPGRPGSVDKGTPEQRGERLIVTTRALVEHEEFLWNLQF